MQELPIQHHFKPSIAEKRFVKKTIMPNPVKSLCYIKYFSLSIPRLIKWSARSKSLLFTSFSKTWLTIERRLTRGSFGICKFGNPFATITGLYELYLRFKRCIMFVQTKRWFLWTQGGAGRSTSSWKPWRWVRLDLILMMKDI